MAHMQGQDSASGGLFTSETAGLSEATASTSIDLADGETVGLRIGPVVKQLGDARVRMLAYNDAVPGPTLRVAEGSEITVQVTNHADLESTVHWHGLRLENAYDGTHETQAPIPVGDTFSYRITFPDPGIYWYHPHIREDYAQEMGLYGNIVVTPADPDYWPPVHREIVLTLDDVLVEDGKIAPFARRETNFAAMGRFGNVMLIGGETDLSLVARQGEVLRFYLTNTANTRFFNVTLPGARMKLVGGDSGRYEHEQFVDSVLLAPSERAVIDVRFEQPGRLTLEHRTSEQRYSLATIDVSSDSAPPLARPFHDLRHNPEWVDMRARVASCQDAPPDRTLAFVAEIEMSATDGPTSYSCPMHPEVTSDEPGRCPKCGMKLLAADTDEGHAAHGGAIEGAGGAHVHGTAEDGPSATPPGIEWEDDMVAVNRSTTSRNMRWKIVDRATGAVNHEIDWQFRVGDQVKLRLINEMDSDHPMPHPFHIHGAGRFVILARDGVEEPNLVWKDTVLVGTGETVDLLLDITNAGRWMAHCHIAEHHESGMMFSFTVV